MPTCAFVTLGCKVNQYDTQAMREELARHGYQEVNAGEAADLYVVNTCCVTRESHRKSLQHVRRIARRHPGAMLVVTGCSVEAHGAEIEAIPGVGCLVGNEGKAALAALVAGERGGEAPAWPAVSWFQGHSRAFVKIEDGCDSLCSYCIVPRVRGRVRSRPPDEVVEEVRRLVGGGYLEVVVTGIHLGAYGLETGGAWSLAPLLRRLVETPGLRRLRLSSIELREVTDELIGLVAASPVLCPHLHIPLQSGDEAVLRAMNRGYTPAEYLARVEDIRRRIDEPALTTDVIVGFPGETDEGFRRTVDVARQAGFSRVHVFPFSEREGTPASRLPGKLPRHVVDARRREMLAAARELSLAYHRRFVGRVVEPLVESRRDGRTGLLCGYTERYVRTEFEGRDDLCGKLAAVEVRQASARGVEGVIRDA